MDRLDTVQYVAEGFAQLEWFAPPFIRLDFLRKTLADVNRDGCNAKQTALAVALRNLYPPRHYATMSLYRYAEIRHVKEYINTINESIEVAHLGFGHVAVTSLFTVVEGVFRMVAEESCGVDRAVSNVKDAIRGLLRKLIGQPLHGPGTNEEWLVVLKGFLRYFDESLYRKTTEYSGDGFLNRHAILHGLFEPSNHRYGSFANFQKLMSIIELQCLLIAFLPGADPNWWMFPDETDESLRLATYIGSLEVAAEDLASRPRGSSLVRVIPLASVFSMDEIRK